MCDNWTFNHFEKRLDRIEQHLLDIKRQGEKTMAQIDDLNAAIQAEDVQVSTLAASITKIDSDVDALLEAVKNGATATDLTTQIQAIQSHTAALQTAIAQLGSEDTKANPTA